MSLVRGFLCCALIGSAYSAPGAAQGLGDPMLPARASPEAGDVRAAESRLRSVILSPERKLALIDGQLVALGGKVGDATLVELSESEAVLRRGDELERLRLLPGVDRKRSAARSVAPAPSEKGGVK